MGERVRSGSRGHWDLSQQVEEERRTAEERQKTSDDGLVQRVDKRWRCPVWGLRLKGKELNAVEWINEGLVNQNNELIDE